MNVVHRDLKLANILLHFPDLDLSFPEIKDPYAKKKAVEEKLKNIDLINSGL